MKLRIQGNSLRLRVTQSEVGRLAEQGCVESSIEFGGTGLLNYSLVSSGSADRIMATFDGADIRVTVPSGVMKAWAESDEVGIESPSHARPQVLIEKDFQCLHNAAENAPDAYPNPLQLKP